MIGCRIAAIGVVVEVGVVVRIQRTHVVEVSWRIATRRRRSDRIVPVIVEAVRIGAMVVAHAWTDMDDHPGLVVVSVPAEAHRLEVFEGGEAEELVTQFVVWHHRIDH